MIFEEKYRTYYTDNKRIYDIESQCLDNVYSTQNIRDDPVYLALISGVLIIMVYSILYSL
jgi:hypothetical protein